MDFDELNDFADWEAKRLEKAFAKSNEQLIFPQAIKLAKEVGELMNEVLKQSGIQRREKIESKEITEKKIREEFADVVLVSCILAKRIGIDINTAIEDKIEKVRARRYE